MTISTRILLAAAVAVAGAAAQTTNWTNTTPATSPSARSNAGLAFDAARGHSVLFGGFGTTTHGDTWTYDGTAWTQRTPTTLPPARDYQGMCFDSVRNVVVMFGGWDTAATPLGDTWTWNGSNWSQVTGAGPSARLGGRLSFDTARGRTVLFGGFDLTNAMNDTWEFNGTAWTMRSPAASPPARDSHAQAFDAVRNETVVFGGWDTFGTPLGDTWVWNGTAWTQRTPAQAPSARTFLAMTQDPGRGRLMLFGGTDLGALNNFSDTWEWNGTNWNLVTTAANPGGHDSHAQVFDAARGRHVLFGGLDAVVLNTDQTWEYGSGSPAAYTTFGTGCAGSAGVPALAPVAGSSPRINQTLQVRVTNLPAALSLIYMAVGLSDSNWNGLPLPVGLGPFGLTNCTGYVSVDVGVIVFGAGGACTWNLPLPNNTNLLGMVFFNQAISIDPAVGNPAGAVVSNAGRAVIGN